MKSHWIAAILMALWAVVLWILLTPDATADLELEHARFKVMDTGGDGARRHQGVFLAGWLLGSLLIAGFVGLLLWGAGSRSWPWFLAGGLLYEGIFTAMCYAYWRSLSAAEVAFIGPFPAGVSWLLFGIWLIPAWFIVVYVVCYRRWIFPPASAERFARLVEQRGES